MSSSVDLLGFQARFQPDRLAALDLTSKRRWTYRALDRAVGQCASLLVAHNIRVGDRVASLAKNRVELIILHLACSRVGAIYVPVNWRLSSQEIQSLLENAKPTLVYGDACLESKGINGIALDQLAAQIDAEQPLPAKPIDDELPSLILYTSGTSGRPKGVMLSERNLTETAINFTLLGQVTGRSVFLCDAPMFHIIGLVTNIRPALMNGASILVSSGFNAEQTLSRLSDPTLGVSHYFCVPQMAQALRAEKNYAPSKLKGLSGLFTGGAPHPKAHIQAWLDDGIAVVDGFGMSEAGTVFGMPLDAALIQAHAGSVGIATPRVRTRIVDHDGRDCPPGEAGELLLKGANITSGYWRSSNDTEAAFTDDGWFRTGDIMREDDQGYYWLLDRSKDMFISGGENVYPSEIEAVLASYEQITECAVIGVADQQWGEVGHLFVVAAASVELDVQSIHHYLREHIAHYKVPKHISVIDALPRNSAGKVQKIKLRAIAHQH